MLDTLTSENVREFVAAGTCDFFSVVHGRRVHICAYDLDCGCTAYGYVYDVDGEDFEYIDVIDMSCLKNTEN